MGIMCPNHMWVAFVAEPLCYAVLLFGIRFTWVAVTELNLSYSNKEETRSLTMYAYYGNLIS